MKTATFAIGMLAAVANAAAYPRLHARYDNSTAIPEPSSSTTLTVIQTNTQTITSCKPTITNCPANQSDIDKLPESDKEPVVVTNTVILTTTVCPVEEAAKVSSSVVQDADNGIITGSTVTLSTTYIQPDAPKETGTPEKPVEGGDNSAEEGEEKPKEEKPKGDKPKEEKPKTDAPKEEPTTTTTATSTSTRYVTIAPKPEETGGENSPTTGSDKETGKGEGDDNVKDNGNGKGEECVPETVTVTAPASTVYVTVGGEDKTQDATTKPTDVTGGDNSAEEGEEIPEDCIPEDEEEDDEEDTEEKPKEETPSKDEPAEDGDNSPIDGADGSGCDIETASSEPPAATSATSYVVPPPAETPSAVTPSVETPAATPIIPGGEGDFVTTSIKPSAAKPSASVSGDAKPTGFYRVRR